MRLPLLNGTSMLSKETMIEIVTRAPRRRAKKAIGRKNKPRTSTWLKKEADRLMSLFVRQKYADRDGLVKCYTCPYQAHWKKMQNGHLVSRYYLATRYDERNCRPQCYTCNMWRNGMTPHFAAKLQEELGQGIVEELYEKARGLTKDFDYQSVIQKYTNKITALDKQ